MNTKTAASVLLAGAILWLGIDVYWTIERFSGDSWRYYKTHPLKLIMSTINVFVPITLVIFASAMMKSSNSVAPKYSNENLTEADAETPVPTIGDWLLNYLIVAIPLVGLVFLIVWANDGSNRVRKNWAAAMLIWTGIILLIVLIYYLSVSGQERRRYYDLR